MKPFWEPEDLGAGCQGEGTLGGICRTPVSLRNPTSGRQVYGLRVTEQWAGKSTSWTFTRRSVSHASMLAMGYSDPEVPLAHD